MECDVFFFDLAKVCWNSCFQFKEAMRRMHMLVYWEFVSRKGNGCPLYVTCEVSIFYTASLVNLLLCVAPVITHLGKLEARLAQTLNLAKKNLLSCLGVGENEDVINIGSF